MGRMTRTGKQFYVTILTWASLGLHHHRLQSLSLVTDFFSPSKGSDTQIKEW